MTTLIDFPVGVLALMTDSCYGFVYFFTQRNESTCTSTPGLPAVLFIYMLYVLIYPVSVLTYD